MIGDEKTCIAMEMERVLDIERPRVNRRAIEMDPGDEALVFRITLPPNGRRLATRGDIGVDFLAEHCEIGLLRRTWR